MLRNSSFSWHFLLSHPDRCIFFYFLSLSVSMYFHQHFLIAFSLSFVCEIPEHCYVFCSFCFRCSVARIGAVIYIHLHAHTTIQMHTIIFHLISRAILTAFYAFCDLIIYACAALTALCCVKSSPEKCDHIEKREIKGPNIEKKRHAHTHTKHRKGFEKRRNKMGNKSSKILYIKIKKIQRKWRQNGKQQNIMSKLTVRDSDLNCKPFVSFVWLFGLIIYGMYYHYFVKNCIAMLQSHERSAHTTWIVIYNELLSLLIRVQPNLY